MRSFAALATFATFAFSAVTSALPTSSVPLSIPAITDLDLSILDVPTIAQQITALITGAENVNYVQYTPREVTDNLVPTIPNNPLSTTKERGLPQGIPDLLVACNTKVFPLVKGLVGSITGDIQADAALKLALGVLGQIKVILADLVAEIKVVLSGDLSLALCFQGKVLDIHIVAKILADLIAVVVLVIGLVIKIAASLDISALLALVFEIVGLLALIVGLVLKVAGGLLAILVPLLAIVVKIVVGLKLTALIKVFAIVV